MAILTWLSSSFQFRKVQLIHRRRRCYCFGYYVSIPQGPINTSCAYVGGPCYFVSIPQGPINTSPPPFFPPLSSMFQFRKVQLIPWNCISSSTPAWFQFRKVQLIRDTKRRLWVHVLFQFRKVQLILPVPSPVRLWYVVSIPQGPINTQLVWRYLYDCRMFQFRKVQLIRDTREVEAICY